MIIRVMSGLWYELFMKMITLRPPFQAKSMEEL
jgi:hypothetical protein